MFGLTGAVGAGKTTAAAAFGARGCSVLDVDRMGHEALDAQDVAGNVAREFGPDVTSEDGRIDRAALARRVFSDATLLRRLEAIVHPVVRARVERELGTARRAAPRAIVIDCALLFESGLDRLCDATIVVDAADLVRERRVAASRGWTADEMRRREAAQIPAAEKKARAGRVLENDGSADDLRRRVGELLDELAPVGTSGSELPAAGRHER